MENQLKVLFQNYIKVAEVMLNTAYRNPKDACYMATQFHKLFDKYGNRPKLLSKEIQKNYQMDMYLIYVNYLKDVRKEYLKIRKNVDYPWSVVEDDTFNKMYYKLMTPECERVLIKYNFADPNKYNLKQEQVKAVKDVEKAILEVEKKAEDYLKSNKKFRKYSNLISTIRPQLYAELFDLRSELSDERFKEEVEKLKCVDVEKCKLTKSGKPKIRFIADSISTIVSNQIKEIVDTIICQNEDFKIKRDNHYNIECGKKLSNIHRLVENIIERKAEESESPSFDDILKEVLKTILEPRETVKFGKVNSIKEYRSIKSYLNRSKKKSNFGRKGNSNPEETIFRRIIDFTILFGIIFFIGKYSGEFMKQITDLWLQGEETRMKQLSDERDNYERRQQTNYERRREEDERRREEDHQRRILEFEAADRRFKEFRKSLMNQISDPSLDYEKQNEVDIKVEDLKYDGPNKMLELFLEPSEYTAQVTRKKGLFKPPTGNQKKGLFKPRSQTAVDVPVSEKLIESLVILLMGRLEEIQTEHEILIEPEVEPVRTSVPKPTTKPVRTSVPKPTTKPVRTSVPKPNLKTRPNKPKNFTKEVPKRRPFSMNELNQN